jgi:hypothetical protein
MVGKGAAVVAVGGAGVLGWRATTEGVFATGTGPAYAAWDEWPQRPTSPLDLVRAAVLAASAHNTQPWVFRISPEGIDLIAITSRNIGAVDPLRREMYISLGCALENLVLAARASGHSPTVTVLPRADDPIHAARVTLGTGQPDISSLYRAIPGRHTHRGRYERRAVPPDVMTAIERLADVPEVKVIWWTGSGAMKAFGDLTVRATEALAADAEQAADDYRWFRGRWREIQRHRDGITMDATGLPFAIRTLAKVLPDSPGQYRAGFVRSTRDTHVATAAAFGALVVRNPLDNVQRIQAGRVWQRIHLWATTQDVAMQPLNQAVERAEREQTAGLRPEFGAALEQLLPERGWSAVMPFRIGYPTAVALKSPRRRAADVVISS